MVGKMSLCIIKYTYTRYVGVDIEKYTRGIYEYVKEAFGELQPQMSEPGTIPDMPDYLDVVLIKKDGSNFLEMDIVRRAINIPTDYQLDGLVLETLSPTVMVLNTRKHTNIINSKDKEDTSNETIIL